MPVVTGHWVTMRAGVLPTEPSCQSNVVFTFVFIDAKVHVFILST